jgi:hypothetical protein
LLCDGLRAQERPGYVDIQCAPPFLSAHFKGVGAADNAREAEEYIDISKSIARSRGGGINSCIVGDVECLAYNLR